MTEEVFRVRAPACLIDNSNDVDIAIPPRHALILVSHDCRPVQLPIPVDVTEVTIERIADPTPDTLSLMPFAIIAVPVEIVGECLGMSRDMATGIVRDLVAQHALRTARTGVE